MINEIVQRPVVELRGSSLALQILLPIFCEWNSIYTPFKGVPKQKVFIESQQSSSSSNHPHTPVWAVTKPVRHLDARLAKKLQHDIKCLIR